MVCDECGAAEWPNVKDGAVCDGSTSSRQQHDCSAVIKFSGSPYRNCAEFCAGQDLQCVGQYIDQANTCTTLVGTDDGYTTTEPYDDIGCASDPNSSDNICECRICNANFDCAGVCGGSATVDECGVCGGSGIPLGKCDCSGSRSDCAGVCGGSTIPDECGVCGGSGIPAGSCDCDGRRIDCAGVCGGSTTLDECGVCGGSGIPPGKCDCDGTPPDCAGVCGGSDFNGCLTDANFKAAVAACVGHYNGEIQAHGYGTWVGGEDPVAGNCVNGEFGPMSGWDTSRVTDMAGTWEDDGHDQTGLCGQYGCSGSASVLAGPGLPMTMMLMWNFCGRALHKSVHAGPQCSTKRATSTATSAIGIRAQSQRREIVRSHFPYHRVPTCPLLLCLRFRTPIDHPLLSYPTIHHLWHPPRGAHTDHLLCPLKFVLLDRTTVSAETPSCGRSVRV
eukprot:SAG11_NODE_1561_length_4677_cov_2.447138_5_plen_446_part_00